MMSYKQIIYISRQDMHRPITASIRALTQRVMFSNIFAKVPMAPPDPIIGVNVAFNADTDPKKVNLGVGAYRDDNAKPYIFKVVRKVEQEIINDPTLNKEYIPIDGIPGFNQASQKLIFGEDCPARKEGRVVTVQALSGTGSLRVGFEFLHQQIPSLVHVSNPTWANHHNIIRRSGLNFKEYPYFDEKTKTFKAKECLEYLNSLQEGNIVLLHACAHNPTGVDPTFEQWKQISEVMKKKKLVPYFDSAYQGFASGDIIKDAEAIRYFVRQGFAMLVSQSYAKNMGLYGERVGALHVVADNKETAEKMLSQLKLVIRANYSSPPIHGARIAERVLSKPENLEQWKSQLKEVANRIISMRTALRGRLEQIGTPADRDVLVHGAEREAGDGVPDQEAPHSPGEEWEDLDGGGEHEERELHRRRHQGRSDQLQVIVQYMPSQYQYNMHIIHCFSWCTRSMISQKQASGSTHAPANPSTTALQNRSLLIPLSISIITITTSNLISIFIIHMATFTHTAILLLAGLLLCCCLGPATSPLPAAAASKTKLLWPLPSKMSLNETAEETEVDPCTINYVIEANPSDYVKQMLNLYLIEVFKCRELKPGATRLNIVVKNPNQMVAEQPSHETYQLTIRTSEKWELVADYYVGFLRGLETFSQLFERKNSKYYINGRPITIDDTPNYVWRGLMIDSSRHFLSVEAIKHTIDALLYNKMSVLHWHITDEDSFPLVVESWPELADYGKFSGIYSRAEVKSIINYARIRGVRVIPEFDTPAHTESWGRSDKLKDIVVRCNNEYQGQFDPTLDLTYQVVKDVMAEVNSTFVDSYAHFGGDEIVESCYSRKPSIKKWMDEHNITTYQQLSIYYRRRQKALWRNINAFKKAIYWANEDIDLPLDADDVIHWWGVAKNVDKLAGRKNQVILSNYDLTYLDVGFGGRRGTGYGTFISWRDLYKFEPRVKDVNVIGGETCMWAEISNAEVQDQKVWIRTSVLNQRLWNVAIDGTKDILNIVERLVAQMRRMKERGFKVSPVTVGLCEKDPTICFN